jgi:hypothetical protein
MNVFARISVGELIDKLTILEIKLAQILDDAKRGNILREYKALDSAVPEAVAGSDEISQLRDALKAVNQQLWRIEDDIRDKERAKAFDADFIALARAVYVTNDRRAELKRRINLASGSELFEEKSYQSYS